MSLNGKKIFVCTPVAFRADDRFWIRDTGLICHSLKAAGATCKCLMPLPADKGDVCPEDLWRVEASCLCSVAWWSEQHPDGVILYSWGLPKYLPIARALHKAGIRFSIHWDGGGDLLPPASIPWRKKVQVWAKFYVMDYLRGKHLRYADAITISPTVRDMFAKRSVYGGQAFVSKCYPMPCPVSSHHYYEGHAKENLLIAIGRWDDEKQKRSAFLMRTLEEFYRDPDQTVVTEIYGTLTARMKEWHAALPEEVRRRIVLKGYVDNAELKTVYNRAQVIVCTSSHESSHIVSAEALCCGCSVVVTNLPQTLSVLHWYTKQQSGRISEEDTPESLACALRAEFAAWESGERHPEKIAATWQSYFYPANVFSHIF